MKTKIGNWLMALAMVFSAGAITSPLSRADLSPQQKWEQLPEAKKEELRGNYRSYQAMPESEKAKLRSNYQRFQAMDPATRERVIQNYKKFKALPPERQKQIAQNFAKFQAMTPEERRKHLEALHRRQENRHEAQKRRKTTH